jgi:hypothetical protein
MMALTTLLTIGGVWEHDVTAQSPARAIRRHSFFMYRSCRI